MDTTLREYLTVADELHEVVLKNGIGLNNSVLEEHILKLQGFIRTIQAVSKRIADVSNIINQTLLFKKNNKLSKTHCIDPYPHENDHVVLRTAHPIQYENIHDIKIPVQHVENLQSIPIHNLYYVKNLNQFAINIAGVIVKGNLANIVDYKTEKSAQCEYGIDCKTFIKNQQCKYYHPPEDYMKLNLPVCNETRNFTAGSWLYCKSRRPKAYYTRHVGSSDTLLHDLSMLKKIQYREEIANREGQLIHDILMYMILNNKGFLQNYQQWF